MGRRPKMHVSIGGGRFPVEYLGRRAFIDNVYFYNSTADTQPTISTSISGGSINVSFATQNGSNYTLQYKTNLTDAVWQTLSTVGLSQSIGDTMNQTSRFYRLYVH